MKTLLAAILFFGWLAFTPPWCQPQNLPVTPETQPP